jgi:hypothetical protein
VYQPQTLEDGMTHRTRAGIALFVLVQGLVSCTSSGSSSAPTTPSSIPQQPAPEPPPTSSQVTGFVLDTAGRSISGAVVEILDGPQAGTSAMSDGGGRFSLTAIFDSATRFRASKEGYVDAVQTINAVSAVKLAFSMALLGTPVDISGEYTVTFIADSACADLPNEARTRVYPATVGAMVFPGVPANTEFLATLKSANLDSYYHQMFIALAGDYLVVDLSDNYVLDEIAPETYFAVGGVGDGSVGTSGVSTISTTFRGSFDYCAATSDIDGAHYHCPNDAVAHARCESKNHQIVLTRR